jgi:hypothetical protein
MMLWQHFEMRGVFNLSSIPKTFSLASKLSVVDNNKTLKKSLDGTLHATLIMVETRIHALNTC